MPRSGEIDVRDFIKQKQNKSKIPMLNKNYKYLTPKEYAIFTGKHPVTIAKWLLEGRIEGAFKLGGRWKIPVKD